MKSGNALKSIIMPFTLAVGLIGGQAALVFSTVRANAQPATARTQKIKPPPAANSDLQDLSPVFNTILIQAQQSALTRPDMARLGMETMQQIFDEMHKLSGTKIEYENSAENQLGLAMALFQRLPEIASKTGVKEKDILRISIEAIEQMMRKIDTRADYFTPEDMKAMDQQNNGKFAGIGIRFDKEKGEPVRILKVMLNSPAEAAGLKSGDLITHVNGEPVQDLDLKQVSEKMSGEVDTAIRLTVKSGNAAATEVSITRAYFDVKVVESRLIGDIGYISLDWFNRNAAEEIREALASLTQESGGKLAGIVLDLRNNPGGFLDVANDIADDFLHGGTITKVASRDYETDFKAVPGTITDLPMVVLINEYSASASELVAGALQDHGRALVVGQTSYGKGTVQRIFGAGEHGFKFTTARFHTPSGDSPQKIGIMPNLFSPTVDDGKSDNDDSIDPLATKRDPVDVIGVCRQDPAANQAAIPAAFKNGKGEVDQALLCGAETLKKKPIYSRTQPVPAAPKPSV